MHEHVFVDESKAKGFILAAVPVPPGELASLRSVVGALRLHRQRRLHFKSESDGRRRAIIASLAEAGARAQVYDATGIKDGKMARDAAIARLADDVIAMRADRLVLELDDSARHSDRIAIRTRLLKHTLEIPLRYEHLRASQECLLAVPDAIAWCWARGNRWRKLVEPLISQATMVKLRKCAKPGPPTVRRAAGFTSQRYCPVRL